MIEEIGQKLSWHLLNSQGMPLLFDNSWKSMLEAIGTSICEVYCDHIASYMLHSLLFTDIFPLLIDQDSQLQLIIHSMLIRKLQTDLLRLDTYIRPRLQKNQRFFGQALIAHLNRMLQIILPNANDLRKGSPRIGLKQLLHYTYLI